MLNNKRVFFEILRGHTVIETDLGRFNIKHLSNFEICELDEKYEEFFNKARNEGLPTNEYQIQEAIKLGLWSKEKDKEILDTSIFIEGQEKAKQNLPLKSQKDAIKESIKNQQKKLHKLNEEKLSFLTSTAESYAEKQLNNYYVFRTLRKSDINTSFTEEEFNDLPFDVIKKLAEAYGKAMSCFKIENIKKIALIPDFTNIFYLCNDDPYIFYGLPVIKLTAYQTQLFTYGKYFKHILSEARDKVAKEFLDNPDDLIDWYEGKKSVDKILKDNHKDAPGASSIVGATKEDLKHLGLDDNVIDIAKEAKKRGGLNFQEIIALHGG